MKVLIVDPGYLRRVAMRGTGRTTRMLLRAILAAEHQDVIVVLQYPQQVAYAVMKVFGVFPKAKYVQSLRQITIGKHTIRFITPSDEGFTEWTKTADTSQTPVFLDHAVLENKQ